MPNRNGTGPTGAGPRTGWGMGNCPPVDTERPADELRSTERVPEFGYGRGLAMRRGMRPGRGRGGFGRGRW